MTSEQIEKFLQAEYMGKSRIQISFRGRPGMTGIFIRTNDFTELKSKNLWRIVSESRLGEFAGSNNNELARIFSGNEITRLSLI